jgi:hypothetical protein
MFPGIQKGPVIFRLNAGMNRQYDEEEAGLLGIAAML